MKEQGIKKILMILAGPFILFIYVALFSNLTPAGPQSAQEALADTLTPIISAVDPTSAFNDMDTTIVITGTDFTAIFSGTDVITSPTAYLGNTLLQDVTWVTSTLLTGTVPWGMDPYQYPLSVTNPDGGTGLLSNAFTVKQGIGEWNGGNMFGGRIKQILLKPGDPNTVYALGEEVGLFRSRDGGDTWRFISNQVIGHSDFVIDPHRPSRLYTVRGSLFRSDDEGDTFKEVPGLWPDGNEIGDGQIFVSPHDAQLLLVSSAVQPDGSIRALGLSKSTDDGVSWVIIEDMAGISVRTLAFHPTNPQQMVLGTSDGRVFQSTDSGDHWTPVVKPPIDDIGVIAYNPFASNEVWVAGAWLTFTPGVYKSIGNLTGWEDVFPHTTASIDTIDFTGATSVYMAAHYGGGWHSDDDGQTWQPFGPPTGGYDYAFTETDPNLIYMGGYRYGFYKSVDGGQTWEVKNQGLSALIVYSIEAPISDSKRVYAVIDGWDGIFRSLDSAVSWEFISVINNIQQIRVDPFDTQHLYLTSDFGFYSSNDGGTSWVLGDGTRHFTLFQPDPFHQGRILSAGSTWTTPPRPALYVSTDYGLTWDEITVAAEYSGARDIAFDNLHPGVVYLTTDGSGVYRSVDYGETWERIAVEIPELIRSFSLAIASYPQPMIIIDGEHQLFRSSDGGDTWVVIGCEAGAGVEGRLLFVDGDSRRLYAATFERLYMSSDGGDSCQPASGSLGRLRTTALSYSGSGDQTILYAATTGGDPNAPSPNESKTSPTTITNQSTLDRPIYMFNNFTLHVFMPLVRQAPPMPSNLIDAGIYRYVNH